MSLPYNRIGRTGPSGPRASRRSGAPRPLVVALTVLLLHAAPAAAGVSLFDQLATPDRPFFLKLRTHRGPLVEGGVRGTFWVDGQMVGKVLTGADGYGYLKFTARTTGTFKLSARTPSGEAQARLRVISPSQPVVVMETETLLWKMLTGDRGERASRAIRQMAASFELVYLSRPMGRRAARQLVRERELPERVILTGNSRRQFEQLVKRGVLIFAVVGSARFTAAARNYSPRGYSFEKSPHARRIANWDDLLNQLKQAGDAP